MKNVSNLLINLTQIKKTKQSLFFFLCVIFFLFAFLFLLLSDPLSPAEISRSVPRQQNDPHPAGLSGWELSHHHVHLLLALQLQRGRNQIHPDVWTTVEV